MNKYKKTSFFHTMYKVAKPILFQLDPEIAHNITMKFLQKTFWIYPNLLKKFSNETTKVQFYNTTFAHPIGIAAGFDKHALFFPMLEKMGASFCEIGTFTKTYQEGNERPRLFRYYKEQALVNRMGFNNPGIDKAIANIQKYGENPQTPFQIPISIGKSKDTAIEQASIDYKICIEKIQKQLQQYHNKIPYIAINISSPNTKNLRKLQDKEHLKELLQTIKQATSIPIAVKLAPDFPQDDTKQYTQTLEDCLRFGADSFIICNTSNSSEYKLKIQQPNIAGGISGSPIQAVSLNMLKIARKVVPSHIPIISTGGIMHPKDVWQRIQFGANLVQVYTGMIFYGIDIIYHSLQYIHSQMKKHQISNLESVRE